MKDIVDSIPNFITWSHADKIKFFAWCIHSRLGKDGFTPSDIRNCYDQLNLDKPTNISTQLAALASKKPKEVLKVGQGYKLEKRIRDALEIRYGQRATTVQIHELLLTLPSKIPNVVERDFLNEAITCLKSGAPRAAIIMCWNLAFDHLCNYIVKSHLTAFNTAWPKRYSKRNANSSIKVISNREDFESADLKESEIIEICHSANIISPNVHKILVEKLNRRNVAAHPNTITFTPLQAEDFISDLVNNVVLLLV